ncbi:ankyrin repeat domain-containing protein 17-like [Portunus trituberculatus]|uniref:ankyrin repeat domain-containing protein 17-like n=1 Tax=Portunus trituberculatus TaxID=210409 RepID=UPI001E1CBEA2|nr:ankyrin repeat domain-containing protein 17-like [Portunus trituberculatus]
MSRAWWTCLFLLGLATANEKPSGSDVVQFMIHKDTGSASAAVEDQPDLINWRDEKGWSLLHHAAWHGSSEVINSLVKAGAEVDLKDLVKGVTPLMAAAEKGQEEALKTLVKAGADVNATDSEGKGVVVRSGSSSVLRLLLDAGIDLDHRDSLGNTPVMKWAQEGRADMLIEALPHCPDITLTNHNDLTALDVATMNRNVNATKLIEDKIQVMCVTDGVHYPLNHTRYEGCHEVRCEAKCQWTKTGNIDQACSDVNIDSLDNPGGTRHNSEDGRPISAEGMLLVTVHQRVRQAMCP